MRSFLLPTFLVLGACSSGSSTLLTKTDWTNGQQPCSENRLSFRNNQVAYYPRGSKPLVLFEIKSMELDHIDRSITNVAIKPSGMLLKELAGSDFDLPPNLQIILRYRVIDDRLLLVGTSDTDGTKMKAASPKARHNFNLIRCPV